MENAIETITHMESNDTQFTVKRDDGLDIVFTGELIATISSRKNDTQKRWTELSIYKTTGGSYICEELGCSTRSSEVTIHAAGIAEDAEGIVAYFGKTWLSKQLFELAEIPLTTFVK